VRISSRCPGWPRNCGATARCCALPQPDMAGRMSFRQWVILKILAFTADVQAARGQCVAWRYVVTSHEDACLSL
jgi:hypothetical protein